MGTESDAVRECALVKNICFFRTRSNITAPYSALPMGGFLLCPGSGTNNNEVDAVLMKLNENGGVSWCHAFGKPNGYEWFLNAIQTRRRRFYCGRPHLQRTAVETLRICG